MRAGTQREQLEMIRRLRDAGIPLDEKVVGDIQAACRGLSIHQAPIFLETSAFDLYSGGTGYMLSLVIYNASERTVWPHQYRLEIPWWEPQFCWLPDPLGKVPREYTYSFPAPGPVGFERDVVLNHRLGRKGRLHPGDCLEGLLLGVGQAPIPQNYQHRQLLRTRFSVFDERGNKFESCVKLFVDRAAQLSRRKREEKLGKKRKSNETQYESVVVLE